MAKVRPDSGADCIAVGPIGHVAIGQHVSMEGRWASHATFGRQFKVQRVLVDDPRTVRGLERYLAGGAVKGLGPTFARRVVAAFGLETLRIIEDEPERLLQVDGIGKKRVEAITAHWERDRAHREVHATLRGFGVGQALANRIVERFGDKAMAVLTREPYRLAAEVRGVGFRTADHIARENGISPDHPSRAEAAASHLLSEAEGQGHCFLPEGELLLQAHSLDVPRDAATAALDRMQLAGAIARHPAADPAGRPVYSPDLDAAEDFVAWRLGELAEDGGGTAPDLSHEEKTQKIALNGDQRKAVQAALIGGLTVITGGPGTGKTTIVKVLLAAARRRGEQWLLAAPTGRAARRLSETTGAEGKTLHRLLEFNPRTSAFTRGLDKPLDAEGVLIDEASMVDLRLFAHLLKALPPGCRLVLVGDADQLPSVGPGRVLGELVESGRVPVCTLREVYRQAQDSGIVRNAWRINGGQLPISGERDDAPVTDFFLVDRGDAHAAQATLVEVVARRLAKKGFDPLKDVQVLTPMHNGPLGTVALNQALQATLNPNGDELKRGNRVLRTGDRVIQVRNDYDNEIFNGDTGTVLSIAGSALVVDFDGRPVALTGDAIRDLELAYAISIHKSQGSEYPAVVVAMHRSHRIMLRRNLLYTAITRARRFCCVVGDAGALRTAVGERGGDRRFTRLSDRLMALPGG